MADNCTIAGDAQWTTQLSVDLFLSILTIIIQLFQSWMSGHFQLRAAEIANEKEPPPSPDIHVHIGAANNVNIENDPSSAPKDDSEKEKSD